MLYSQNVHINSYRQQSLFVYFIEMLTLVFFLFNNKIKFYCFKKSLHVISISKSGFDESGILSVHEHILMQNFQLNFELYVHKVANQYNNIK